MECWGEGSVWIEITKKQVGNGMQLERTHPQGVRVLTTVFWETESKATAAPEEPCPAFDELKHTASKTFLFLFFVIFFLLQDKQLFKINVF